MNRHAFAAGVALAIGIAVCPGPTRAVDLTRFALSHGSANCQAALPVFDGNIRKRPMGISNEGTGPAFITCDSEDSELIIGQRTISEVGIYFTNRSTATVTVSCTLVDGLVPFFTPVSFPKTSASTAANVSRSVIWDVDDNGGESFQFPAISCNLPAGVEINVVQFIRAENVGE